MSTSEAQHFFIGMLNANPAVAQALGTYLADFATLEVHLAALMGLAVGGEDMAHAIFGRINSISSRIDIATDCIELSSMESEKKQAARVILAEIKTRNGKRNEYVHGIWETSTTTHQVKLSTWVLASGRKTQVSFVTEADIYQEVKLVRELSAQIIRTFFLEQVQTVSGS